MKTCTDIKTVSLTVKASELLNKKWYPFENVSKRLKEEYPDYQSLRVRLYNSASSGKYNLTFIAGIKCIEVWKPMHQAKASLVLQFNIVKGE